MRSSFPPVISPANRLDLEVIDLTHAPTVALFRTWDTKEPAFVQLLRFIRVSSADPYLALVSRPGKHFSIIGSEAGADGESMDMDTTEK